MSDLSEEAENNIFKFIDKAYIYSISYFLSTFFLKFVNLRLRHNDYEFMIGYYSKKKVFFNFQ